MGKIYNKELFISRLKEIMQQHSETTYSLAEYLHLTPPTISRYLSGEMSPKITTIQIISQKYNLNPAWLMGGNVEKYFNSINNNFVKIPVIKEISNAKSDLSQDNVIGYIGASENISDNKNVFGFKAIDDSMNNTRIYKDDIIIIKRQSDANNGDIIIALLNDVITIKRFYITGAMVTLVPESTNTIYKPIVVDKSKVKVIGKVIGGLIKF